MSGAQYSDIPGAQGARAVTAAPSKERPPMEVLRGQITNLGGELKNALPSHIKPEKFQRVVLTVVQQTPDLLQADRKSLLGACMKCAADGLIPDGREAALVIFNTKKKDGGWEKRVQYMPMIGGLLKRARNSGEIAGIIVNVVHEKDDFVHRPDDFDRPVEHRAPKLGVSRGPAIGAYALVKLKDGTLMHEVMDREEIEQVRAVSRAKDSGPWVQWWDQMARKTVFRRLSKYLPMDAETDDMIRRDEESDIAPAGPVIEGAAEPERQQIVGKLDMLEDARDEDGVVLEGEVETDDMPDPDVAWITVEIEKATDDGALKRFLNQEATKAKMRKLRKAAADQVDLAIKAQRHGFAAGK